MKSEPNKLARQLRAGQTIYLLMMHPSAYVLEDRPWYFIRAIRVLSDKAPPPKEGEEVHAAPRRWIAARIPAAAVYKSRRQAERYRKAFQEKALRGLGSVGRDR